MNVRFLMDFRGVLTNERFYATGAEAEFDEATAAQLVADGRAEPVAEPEQAQPVPSKRRR